MERVKISSTNLRLETTVQQKEEKFQVIIDVIKNSTVDAEVFRKILDICPRVKGEEFIELENDEDTLTFLIDLGYKGPLHKYTNMYVDHMSQPWRTLAAIINKCLSGKTIPPKRRIGKGSQGKKTVDDSKEIVDVSEESKPEPFKRKTASKSISIAESKKKEAAKQVHATHVRIMIESAPKSARKKTGSRSSRIIVIQDTPKKDDKEGDADDEGDDHISDTQDTNDEDDETKSDEDEIYTYKIHAKKTKEAKDDSKKAKLPPISFSLYVSSSFGDQFLKIYSNTSLIGTAKDTTDAEINSLLDIKIQYDVQDIQSPYMLKVPVSVIFEPTVLTPVQETSLAAPVTTLPLLFISSTQHVPQQTTTPIPPPPIITDALIITSVVPKSDALFAIQLRVAKLEKNVSKISDDLEKDKNAMDKGVADLIKNHKQKHNDDDENPLAGPNQGKKTKKRRSKELESSKKPSSTKETPKGKALSKGSKIDVVHDDDQPQDTSELKTSKTPNQDWVKKPPWPPTLRVKSVSVKKLHGYGHFKEIIVKRADHQLYKFKEGDFVDLYLNDIKDILLLAVQHRLFHLTNSDIVDFIVALRMFSRSLVIKKRVKDLQLGLESHQKKLNITPPQQTFPEFKFKELYTPSHKPPGGYL
nr:hypothetical protein [Tanacetum cinerariifolium]